MSSQACSYSRRIGLHNKINHRKQWTTRIGVVSASLGITRRYVIFLEMFDDFGRVPADEDIVGPSTFDLSKKIIAKKRGSSNEMDGILQSQQQRQRDCQ